MVLKPIAAQERFDLFRLNFSIFTINGKQFAACELFWCPGFVLIQVGGVGGYHGFPGAQQLLQ